MYVVFAITETRGNFDFLFRLWHGVLWLIHFSISKVALRKFWLFYVEK